MATLEQLKEKWIGQKSATSDTTLYDHVSFEKLLKQRVRKHTNASLQYFWASFTLQIIVYALTSHVIIKYWADPLSRSLCIGVILLYIPFTYILMRRFKRLAITTPAKGQDAMICLHDYILNQISVLQSFYSFKKWYEVVLIPLSSAAGVMIVFRLFVPGGIEQHWTGAIITFAITLISCVAAIFNENKKSFKLPIHQLQNILDEFKSPV